MISDDPFRDFNTLTNFFNPFKSASSVIAETAIIGENTIIQPNVFIGNNVQIGSDCVIHSNVCIYDNTIIGNQVTIHCGTVLGADAFYYKNRPEKFDKLLSGGNVVIEDHVYIGAGAIIKQGKSKRPLVVGKGATIAAGAFVTKSVPTDVTMFGNPATVLTSNNLRKK